MTNKIPTPFPFKKTTGKYKGVSYNTFHKKYTAQISIPGKQLNLGLFPTEIEAARAYNEAAKVFDKNFINEIELGDD